MIEYIYTKLTELTQASEPYFALEFDCTIRGAAALCVFAALGDRSAALLEFQKHEMRWL